MRVTQDAIPGMRIPMLVQANEGRPLSDQLRAALRQRPFDHGGRVPRRGKPGSLRQMARVARAARPAASSKPRARCRASLEFILATVSTVAVSLAGPAQPAMDDISQKLSRTIWIGVGLLIVILCRDLSSPAWKHAAPRRFTPRARSGRGLHADQPDRAAVTLADLRGQVWVADIIFTRCAGPCPRMTKQMKSLQAALPADSRAKLVTLTTDPEFDTPEVLKKYAERFNANADRWMFLTGAKKEIAALGIDSLKLTAVEKKPEEREDPDDLFIHSTIFIVVDKQARSARRL